MLNDLRNFKMEWAKIHLDTLETETVNVLSNPANLYRIRTQEDSEHGLLHIHVDSFNPGAILTLGLRAGDFICNLRASLDHLAWALAKLGKRHPSAETCFPVCPRDGVKTQAKISAATTGFPPEAIAKVKEFQPYHYGDAYKSHHLWKLNYLWNLDKHRNMALYSIDSGVLFEVAEGVTVKERKFDDRAIVTLPLSAKHKVRFNPRPETTILFGDEERGIKFTLQELREIYDFVSTEVVPPLIRFLPQVEARS